MHPAFQFYKFFRGFLASFLQKAERGASFIISPYMKTFCYNKQLTESLYFDPDFKKVVAVTAQCSVCGTSG